MTKNEQNRIVAWRLKLLREATELPRNVAQACRHFGISRNTFYKWQARHRAHGEAGLLDRSRAPRRPLGLLHGTWSRRSSTYGRDITLDRGGSWSCLTISGSLIPPGGDGRYTTDSWSPPKTSLPHPATCCRCRS
jgi:Helix-turn-helix domain